MNWKLFLLAFSAILVLGAVVSCGSSEKATPTVTARQAVPPAPTAATSPPPAATAPGEATTAGTPLTVNLDDPASGGGYRFDPKEFHFKVGETVTFALNSKNESHTFTVDDLRIDQSVAPNSTVNFTFTFDKPGTYHLICIPHESLGMTGTIVVGP